MIKKNGRKGEIDVSEVLYTYKMPGITHNNMLGTFLKNWTE